MRIHVYYIRWIACLRRVFNFDNLYHKQENELFSVLVFETMTCLVNLRINNQYGKSVGFQLEPFGVFGSAFIIGQGSLLNHVSS